MTTSSYENELLSVIEKLNGDLHTEREAHSKTLGLMMQSEALRDSMKLHAIMAGAYTNSKLTQHADELFRVFKDLLKDVERNDCEHDETERLGAIWTKCTQCGQMWADDEGGFVPHEPKPIVTAAYKLLDLIEGKATA